MSVDGILNLNKPQDMTSFQVVRLVRVWTGMKRVGHGGTLDPMATGVLPVLLGGATRLMEFLLTGEKAYQALIEFGATTDTYDAQGQVLERGDPSGLTPQQIEQVLGDFRGEILQVPPMVSALKYQGVPLYRLARQGKQVERLPRTVVIRELSVTAWDLPRIAVRVTCGSGTYIRSLAHDLGQALGCGAYLKELTRLRSGPLVLHEAMTLEQFREAVERGLWQEYLYPLDLPLLASYDAAILGSEHASLFRAGRVFPVAGPIQGVGLWPRLCRAYGLDGGFLGVLEVDGQYGTAHPKKVFI